MMLLLKNINQHLSWELTQDTRTICQSLFQALDLNYFDYARFYPDHSCILLYTDNTYLHVAFNSTDFKPPPFILSTGQHLWESYIQQDFLHFASTTFQHTYGLTIHNKKENYTEIFNFATHAQNQHILHIYFNHFDILEKFICFFLEKAEPLLKKLDKNRLYIPPLSHTFPSQEKHFLDNVKLAKFYTQTLYHIKTNTGMIKLTKREAQCLFHLLKGNSAKQIGRLLDISHRTVEIYINNILKKCAITSRMKIFHKIHFDTTLQALKRCLKY